jgi:hypothetical protein
MKNEPSLVDKFKRLMVVATLVFIVLAIILAMTFYVLDTLNKNYHG